jgi:hypothetical protein
MILFLRNDKRESIVDIDCYVKTEEERKFVEISSSVIIKSYSEFLLKNIDRKDEIISDFSEIDELRGWLWESYFMGGDNDPKEYDNVIEILKKGLKEIAEKYDLAYVED